MGALKIKHYLEANYKASVFMLLTPECAELSFQSYLFNALDIENQQIILSLLSDYDKERTEFYYIEEWTHGIRIKY